MKIYSLEVVLAVFALTPALFSQQITYSPYIQPGDNGPLGPTDQMIVAWQTDETAPRANTYHVEYGTTTAYGSSAVVTGRVVDNYLAADSSLPVSPYSYGAHTDYLAVLSLLSFDTTYYYRVSGPGLPTNGFAASFHTRKQSSVFAFAVEGDEGYFPLVPNSSPITIVNYEARIAHLIYNAGNIALPDSPSRSPAEFVLNTGDNVYTVASEGNYRDYIFPVLNSDADSNETGAPILRSLPYYITIGNHDVGSTGVSVNMLADNSSPRFSGNLDGGDALAHFNNFYYPLNGPTGFDVQYTWNSDSSLANGMYFSYLSQNYTSPAAIEAYRASTTVNSGTGLKRQIDYMGNFSFDYGNAHFLFLDANPHLFNGNLPSGSVYNTPPPTFSPYPSGLRQWLINDLDSSKQLWKIVVYHQPAFSSGDATIVNHQMRTVAKFLEDHGVNVVFNGHEHNYQRTLPIRATTRTASTPSTTAGTPAVSIDTNYDGSTQTVPDGVLYIVEGAGGNRDFDNNLPPPRGSGLGVDQDDSATGTYTPIAGLTVPQGPPAWLDTNLTNHEMINFVPNSGVGPKITTKFKSKVFSFGHVLVNNNSMTLYQISEPLQGTSSATPNTPAPYGTDVNGKPVNDPIPDTVLDGTTGALLSAPATGSPALLDQWTITKPNVSSAVSVQLSAPPSATAGGALVYSVVISNNSAYALNGTQVRLTRPSNLSLADTLSDTLTLQGNEIVSTIGRLMPGTQQVIQIKTRVAANAAVGSQINASASLASGTALPVAANSVATRIVNVPSPPAF
ncbi:MAG: metallophosphoesterase family protein [Acidobacteriaceae bacterium]|nr:metallophosphoesterase family protein [Acidobacteriaceae bacterium]